MRLSPFGPPRSEPRRPDIDDMRPITQQALLVVGLVPLGIGMLGLLSQPGGRWFFVGLVLSSLFVVVAYARSIAFETKHLGESRDFWRDREALIRTRVFLGGLVTFVAGAIALVVAVTSARWGIAGFLLTPVFLAGSFVLLLWGKVP